MKTIPVIFFLALTISTGLSQEINLEEIKTLTKDSTSKYFYDTLVREFLLHPHDFEMTKGMNLYYGKLFSKYYKPHAFNKEESSFNEFLRSENYEGALTVGERILEKDPVNLSLLLKLLKCYAVTKDYALADLTRMQVDILYKAILHGGTGQKREKALKVIDIGDEYAMMVLMNVEGLSRRSIMKSSSIIDVWKIRSLKKGGKKNLYFEVLINNP